MRGTIVKWGEKKAKEHSCRPPNNPWVLLAWPVGTIWKCECEILWYIEALKDGTAKSWYNHGTGTHGLYEWWILLYILFVIATLAFIVGFCLFFWWATHIV